MTLDSSSLQRAMPPGSMRYYAWLFTPSAQREVLAALFLLESELTDSARATHEVAHVRLNWWREEIERLIAGQPQHPATQVLHEAATKTQSPTDWQPLQHMVLAAAQDLAHATYETDKELGNYFCRSTGALCRMALALSHVSASSEQLQAATNLGAFVRQVETLRDLRKDFHQGRLYLPLSILDELGIEYERLQDQSWPVIFTDWLTHRIAQLPQQYAELKQRCLGVRGPSLRSQLVLSELHAGLTADILACIHHPSDRRPDLHALNKLWTAWRAARSA